MVTRTCDPKAVILHGKDNLLALHEITQPNPVQPTPQEEWPKEEDKIIVYAAERKIVKKSGKSIVNFKISKAKVTMQRPAKPIELQFAHTFGINRVIDSSYIRSRSESH